MLAVRCWPQSNHARYWGIYLDDYRSEDAYWAAIRAKFFPYNCERRCAASRFRGTCVA